jgi:hypothetical protein
MTQTLIYVPIFKTKVCDGEGALARSPRLPLPDSERLDTAVSTKLKALSSTEGRGD